MIVLHGISAGHPNPVWTMCLTLSFSTTPPEPSSSRRDHSRLTPSFPRMQESRGARSDLGRLLILGQARDTKILPRIWQALDHRHHRHSRESLPLVQIGGGNLLAAGEANPDGLGWRNLRAPTNLEGTGADAPAPCIADQAASVSRPYGAF